MTRFRQIGDRIRATSRSARLAVTGDTAIRFLAIAVLAFGALLRLNRYIDNRSLFLDEATIASSVLNRNFSELTPPLDYFQIAPIGWLWLVKLSSITFGISEPALRLVPLMAGLASLVLFYALSKRYLSPRAMLVACLFLAMTEPAIHWSIMVKPYSTDMLFTIAMLWLGARANWREISWPSTFALAGLGASAIWFSYPSVFVLAAVGGYGLVRAGSGGGLRRLAPILTIGVIWTISFTLLYFTALPSVLGNDFQYNAWADHFVNFQGINPAEITRQIETLNSVFDDAAGLPAVGGSVLLFLVGLVGILEKVPPEAILLLGPIALAYIASAVGIYPFYERLLLFSVPPLYLLIAHGIERVSGYAKRLGFLLMLLMVALVAYTPIRLAVSQALKPVALEEMRPVTRHMIEAQLPGDSIYVYYGAAPAWRYYTRLLGADDVTYDIGTRSRENPDVYGMEVSRYKGRDRVWFVFSHDYGSEQAFILERVDCLGSLLDAYTQPGAGTYLFDMTHPSKECVDQ